MYLLVLVRSLIFSYGALGSLIPHHEGNVIFAQKKEYFSSSSSSEDDLIEGFQKQLSEYDFHTNEAQHRLQYHVTKRSIRVTQESSTGTLRGSKESHTGTLLGTRKSPTGTLRRTKESPIRTLQVTQESPIGTLRGSKESPTGTIRGTREYPPGTLRNYTPPPGSTDDAGPFQADCQSKWIQSQASGQGFQLQLTMQSTNQPPLTLKERFLDDFSCTIEVRTKLAYIALSS